ncbi:putative 2 [Babesia sp. Xinjiang]|uniref:putative 2 n=1 Tax=Babesia sp. Xinjiang TaxID=462227 RepID=UPI000A22F4CF|nr:putative 2 [Babesia sp. Xinjiang]ORM40094.1 putative 2 [Babesia sp. Xinjiang]
MYTLVFVRHGESTWNKENRFCGWVDKPLTENGKNEAKEGALALKETGISFGTVFTSVLDRAIKTADIILEVLGQANVPRITSWRLNERHYGALQGLDKVATVEKYGLEKVNLWRRSFNIPPPPCEETSEWYVGNDPMYAEIPRNEIPNGESIEQCIKRVKPCWENEIVPKMKQGQPILVVSHGNALRSLMKIIENISDEEIVKLNLPNGVPLVYKFSCDMKIVEKKFLLSDEELKARMDKVANQLLKKN